MNEIANAPLEGVVVGRVLGYELTIGEYEDTTVLGEFDTEDEALIALGRYALIHGNEGDLHAHITQQQGRPELAAVIAPSGSIKVGALTIGHLNADAIEWEIDADAQLLDAGYQRTAPWDSDWAPVDRVV